MSQAIPTGRRPSSPLRVVVLAPIGSSLYSRLVTWLASREAGVEVVGVVVRTPWTWRRLRDELRRDGKRLLAKAYQKLVLRERAYDPSDPRSLRAMAERAALPGRSLAELTEVIRCPLLAVKDHNERGAEEFLRVVRPDVAAFTGGGLIRPHILALPRLGVLNCHMGLLPRYRGMDVVEWPLLEQPAAPSIGLTLHFMERGVDTGPILLRRPVAVEPGDTFAVVRRRFEPAMVELMVQGLRGLRDGTLVAEPQQLAAGRQYFVMHDRLLAAAQRNLAALSERE